MSCTCKQEQCVIKRRTETIMKVLSGKITPEECAKICGFSLEERKQLLLNLSDNLEEKTQLLLKLK